MTTQAQHADKLKAAADWFRDCKTLTLKKTPTGFIAALEAGAAALLASPQTNYARAMNDIQRHMLLTLEAMGVEDGKTLSEVQRRLHVDAPTAMRLFAIHQAVKSLPVPPVIDTVTEPVSEGLRER